VWAGGAILHNALIRQKILDVRFLELSSEKIKNVTDRELVLLLFYKKALCKIIRLIY
jgi:hypothetical protein